MGRVIGLRLSDPGPVSALDLPECMSSRKRSGRCSR